MARIAALAVAVAAVVMWEVALDSRVEALSSGLRSSQASAPATPVLVELFTSEGCSSCPPADALLEKLDRLQPVNGAELIVLSEHVDYWNDIGWKDPYSSREYSERQSDYADAFGLRSVYTPQMVVDGHAEFVGSDERRAIIAIENAAGQPKASVRISSVRVNEDKALAFHVDADPLPSGPAKSAAVLLALADNSDVSQVSRGENAGRLLKHVAVVRNLLRVGSLDQKSGFSKDLSIDLKGRDPRNVRIVAIVQEPVAGRVWGVATSRVSR